MNANSKQDLKEMILRYVAGTATDAERQFVDQYYQHFEDRDDILDSLSQQQQELLGWAMADRISENISAPPKISPLWRRTWFAAAASLLLIMSVMGGLFLMQDRRGQVAEVGLPTPTDFEPGMNAAVLTLSDGNKVVLDDRSSGAIARQGEVTIVKRQDGTVEYDMGGELPAGSRTQKPIMNRIETPAGGQYRIVLPDGTKVWLNAMSSIRFPTFFAGSIRRVEITGECYFEVAEDKKLPFIVRINQVQEITVTGTAFNVNAYPEDAVSHTTLVEGSVRIGAVGHSDQVVLRPGQQASINSKGKCHVGEVDIAEAVAWKYGLFQFNNSDLKTVLSQISRWYNVEVIFEKGVPEKTFTGKIHRNVNASQILDILRYTGVNFQLQSSTLSGVKGKIVVLP